MVMPFNLGALRRADPADRFFWGGKSWRRGPNLPPLSSFSTDLGHFILKLLNFDIYFLFYVNFLSLFRRGGGKQATLGLWGAWPRTSLDQPMALRMLNVATG